MRGISFDTFCFFECHSDTRHLHSFPTRRSSDLPPSGLNEIALSIRLRNTWPRRSSIPVTTAALAESRPTSTCTPRDRKSTRLNSSHSQISYAVFCLKKKTHGKSFDTFFPIGTHI